MRGVSLVYRALPALADIDWTLNPGEHWACLGPNGAGKTSLARILSGQASHLSGEMTRCDTVLDRGVAYVCFEQAKALCDRDRKLDDSEFRADAADPGTTVRSAILGSGPTTDIYQRWIERLRMTHIQDRGLRYVSTGEMRKTLLVKALLSEPAILILDNPVDGLDREMQGEMQQVIEELLTQDSMSVLLLLRAQEDVPAGCSHWMLMRDGHILLQGPAGTVQNDPTLDQVLSPPLPDMTALPDGAERPYQLPESGPLLALHNVSVNYGDVQVLRNVSWILQRGQHCAVSGPNGCGKTTLLSLITGDNHKAYGQDITLFGIKRGSGESVWDIKQKYGQVDTQLHLNFARGMKTVEVVVSGFFDTIGLFDDWGDTQRQAADAWLGALGLAAVARESFDALSFGMQRMVLLARAMVKSPAILLLDEPTLGLDGFHRRMILQAIDHIASQSDTQVIFVSHSAGDLPHCINQHLEFVPNDTGFDVITR